MAIGTYTFLPWLRQGIANNIQSADLDASVKTRASVAVNLTIKGSGGESGDVSAAVAKMSRSTDRATSSASNRAR